MGIDVIDAVEGIVLVSGFLKLSVNALDPNGA